jgi:hypothetical protein
VWTAPGWQGFFHACSSLVGAAMCSACPNRSDREWLIHPAAKQIRSVAAQASAVPRSHNHQLHKPDTFENAARTQSLPSPMGRSPRGMKQRNPLRIIQILSASDWREIRSKGEQYLGEFPYRLKKPFTASTASPTISRAICARLGSLSFLNLACPEVPLNAQATSSRAEHSG